MSGHSLITAIVPKRNSHAVTSAILNHPGRTVTVNIARGTLIKERWYQSFVPVMNPEQEVLEMLVPASEVDPVMREIVSVGRLHLAGSGAVFSIPCSETLFLPGFHQWKVADANESKSNSPIAFKHQLTGVFCVCEPQVSGSIARAAVQAGAPGPTINYCTGRGLRDKLLILRITKSAEKEFHRLVVDDCDANPVFNAMANAGHLDEPGRGFLYEVPIEKGVINLPSVVGEARHAASMQQIISAIDDLKGSSTWRAQEGIDELQSATGGFGLGFGSRLKKRRYLEDNLMLVCDTDGENVEKFTDAALSAGVPGVILGEGRLLESDVPETESGVRLTRERGFIQTVLPADKVSFVRDTMSQAAEAHQITDAAFYTYPVPKALTYLGE